MNTTIAAAAALTMFAVCVHVAYRAGLEPGRASWRPTTIDTWAPPRSARRAPIVVPDIEVVPTHHHDRSKP